MTSTLAHVKPAVLRWARESIGFPIEDAAARIGVKAEKLEGAERGDLLLTLRQAERAARVYDRPLAALFLPEPPAEEPQEAQFRRLPGAPAPPWPPEMQVLVRRVRQRQDAAAELYDTLEEEPPWSQRAAELAQAAGPPPERARHMLGIGFEEQTSWRDPSGYLPLRNWIDAVESLGILVMQDGALPVEAMRGFASTHSFVPAIVVNTQDDPRARAFTIIHEFGHLYLAAVGRAVGPETETWCNEFAGEVLMPRGWMANVLSATDDSRAVERIDSLALTFGVTPYAAAVRVARAGLWPREDIDAVIQEIRLRPERPRGVGGDYYRTQIGRLGPSFIRLVFTALDSQAVSYPAASSLLGGVKVSNFDTLRDYIAHRSELR
jgi:Zn-dependent peptidase ImmA (M78 family)/transcriptional regulator with XRE-family HTH domain